MENLAHYVNFIFQLWSVTFFVCVRLQLHKYTDKYISYIYELQICVYMNTYLENNVIKVNNNITSMHNI